MSSSTSFYSRDAAVFPDIRNYFGEYSIIILQFDDQSNGKKKKSKFNPNKISQNCNIAGEDDDDEIACDDERIYLNVFT